MAFLSQLSLDCLKVLARVKVRGTRGSSEFSVKRVNPFTNVVGIRS